MSPCHLGPHKTDPKSKADTNNMVITDSLSDLEILKDISALWVVNCEHMTTRHEGRLKVSQLELFQWKHELLLFLLSDICWLEE